MYTKLHAHFIDTPRGQEAESILLSCVHCGFCNATCPTYQELGDEREGPRGRIYLIKQLLEKGQATENTRKHLDSCLNCRSCETTCPSGVSYGRLVDIGKEIVEEQQIRPVHERLMRWSIRQVLPFRKRFTPLLRIGQFVRPLLPTSIKRIVPLKKPVLSWPQKKHKRQMLVLGGCAQPGATPNTNAAASRVLDTMGISLVDMPKAGCCGAVSYHLSEPDEAMGFMRRNIDAWWPAIEGGAEAIVITASGCGPMIKDYGEQLKLDPDYAEKAKQVSFLAKDISEVISLQDIERMDLNVDSLTTAVHCPCSLQHGLNLPNKVEQLLEVAGVKVTATKEKHLCCGSAGTYSILQGEMSQRLLTNKLKALNVNNPDRIVTSNIGCQLHLATRSEVPVLHWIELIEQGLQPADR
ncbi:MAG: glycolate oxidase iron-sulfur subunit [Oceanicoccus sp.]|jgi:glycolate oxidase iron-sulfur subunit